MTEEPDLLSRLAAEGYRSWRVPGQHDGEIASLLARVDSDSAFWNLTAHVDLGVARVLNSFSVRMATLAVRRNDVVWIKHGLIGAQLAMIAEEGREVLPTYSLLYRASELIGIDAQTLFREASYLIRESEHETPAEFALRRPEDRSVEAMGYVEGTDRDGFAFRFSG